MKQLDTAYQNAKISLEDLKRGKYCCGDELPTGERIYCHNPLRARGDNLSRELVIWALRCSQWMHDKGRKSFDPREVFPSGKKQHISDYATKCGYHGIVKRAGKVGYWKITMQGSRFLKGNIALPKKVWYLKGKNKDGSYRIVEKDEVYISVADVVPEWKQYADYMMDYILPQKQHLPI